MQAEARSFRREQVQCCSRDPLHARMLHMRICKITTRESRQQIRRGGRGGEGKRGECLELRLRVIDPETSDHCTIITPSVSANSSCIWLPTLRFVEWWFETSARWRLEAHLLILVWLNCFLRPLHQAGSSKEQSE